MTLACQTAPTGAAPALQPAGYLLPILLAKSRPLLGKARSAAVGSAPRDDMKVASQRSYCLEANDQAALAGDLSQGCLGLSSYLHWAGPWQLIATAYWSACSQVGQAG